MEVKDLRGPSITIFAKYSSVGIHLDKWMFFIKELLKWCDTAQVADGQHEMRVLQ